jgi:hypothetical protein
VKKILYLLLLGTNISILPGCRFIDELIHMDSPEILDWRPGEGNQEAEDLYEVSLEFTALMNRNRTEEAFSLTEEEKRLPGEFVWDENRMYFSPYEGFSSDKSYLLHLKKTAEDSYGNSLAREWTGEFFTGTDQEAPVFMEAIPVDYSLITDPRQDISLLFSEVLDQQTFRDALSISPDLKNYLEWRNEKVIIHPLEDFQKGELYTITLSTDLKDCAGNALDQEFDLVYRIADPGTPALDSLILGSSGAELLPSEINSGIEAGDVINGRMNRTLDEEERLSLVTLLPDSSYNLDWDISYENFTLSFENLLWKGYYVLNILDQEYLLLADGEGSRPPELKALAFCQDSSSSIPQVLSLNSALGAGDSGTAFLDFLFARSLNGEISQFSFMDALSIDSSVLTFETVAYEVYDGSQTPPPALVPEPGESLIRIHLNIVDTGLPGIATFSLSENLSDTLGNTLLEPWNLTVNQP